MTKLLIGLGLLILFGALFSLLTALRAKLAPEKPSDGDAPAEPKETEKEEERTVLRAVVRCTGGGVSFTQYQYQGIRDCLAASQLPGHGPPRRLFVEGVSGAPLNGLPGRLPASRQQSPEV